MGWESTFSWQFSPCLSKVWVTLQEGNVVAVNVVRRVAKVDVHKTHSGTAALFPIYACGSSTNIKRLSKVTQPVKLRQKSPAGLVWARKGGKPLCSCILHFGKTGGNTSSGKKHTHTHTLRHQPLALFLHSSYLSILLFYVLLHSSFLSYLWLQSRPPHHSLSLFPLVPLKPSHHPWFLPAQQQPPSPPDPSFPPTPSTTLLFPFLFL